MSAVDTDTKGTEWFVVRKGKIKRGDLIVFPHIGEIDWADGLIDAPINKDGYIVVLRPRDSDV